MRKMLMIVALMSVMATTAWARSVWDDDGSRVVVRDQYGQPTGTAVVNDGKIGQGVPAPGGQQIPPGAKVDSNGNVRDQYGNKIGKVN